jgi:hypothetical protein
MKSITTNLTLQETLVKQILKAKIETAAGGNYESERSKEQLQITRTMTHPKC